MFFNLINILISKWIIIYPTFAFNLTLLLSNSITSFLKKFTFLDRFYSFNDLVWQEGLLIDFLQKKTIDLWIKKFLIYTSYLYNERFLFEKITRFFLNFLIIPLHKTFFFEINSVANLLFINIFIFIFIFFFFVLLFFIF